MKIAHIVRRFTFNEWGGTESVVWNIALQQKAQGLQPEIICTAALDKVGEEVLNGITIKRFPYFYPYFPMPEKDRSALDKKGGNPLTPVLMRYLKEGNFDIFHLHAGGRIANYAIKLGKALHTPCIMSLHGGVCAIPAEEMKLMLKPLKHKFSYGGIIDRLCGVRHAPESRADMLLALSREEVGKLQARYPDIPVQLFPNGILHRELPDAGDFRKKYNIPSDKKVILCISRIDYQKNQKLLLELLPPHKDTHLLLIGPVTASWYYDEILATAESLGVKERLTVIPGLKPDSVELLQALKTAYCFVLPSRHEPFGIAALEALDAKVPLIAAAVGGLKDFLIDAKNALLFEDNNAQSLLEAYNRIEPLRDALISGGEITALEYNWRSIAEKLTAVYRELKA
ncbi:MAG: glycosyltransferase family 4 protein [Lentisphaerae bacterium]|nr:glycosyltransferase family 4 protein [Lentisphaerota bacterium]